MKPLISRLEYLQLEQVLSANAEVKDSKFPLRSQLKRIWQSLTKYLFVSQELRVWYICDDAGKLWWNANNPKTGRSIYFASEAQIRTWVEQHYR